MTTTESATIPGMKAEEATCSTHGVGYTRIFIPRFDLWTGQCPKCKEEEELKQQAQSILAEKQAELRMRVRAAMQEHSETEILEQAEEELQAYLKKCADQWRPRFINDLRSRLYQQETNELEEAMLDEIITELRKAG